MEKWDLNIHFDDFYPPETHRFICKQSMLSYQIFEIIFFTETVQWICSLDKISLKNLILDSLFGFTQLYRVMWLKQTITN